MTVSDSITRNDRLWDLMSRGLMEVIYSSAQRNLRKCISQHFRHCFIHLVKLGV